MIFFLMLKDRFYIMPEEPYHFLVRNGYIERMMNFLKKELRKLEDPEISKAILERFNMIINDKLIFDMFVQQGLLPYYKDNVLDVDELKKKEEEMVRANIEMVISNLPPESDIESHLKQIENRKLPKPVEDRIMRYFTLFCEVYV